MYYKDTNIYDHLPYGCSHPEYCKKNEPCNLAKRIVFVIDPEKVELRLNESRRWLKNNKNPDDITSNTSHQTPRSNTKTYHKF